MNFAKLLPVLSEGDESIDLATVLANREDCLSEIELWALCNECCKALKNISSASEMFQSLCVTPESLAFDSDGAICFLDITTDPDPMYVPPEYEKVGNSHKAHLFSLGMTLFFTTSALTAAEKPRNKGLSPNFQNLLGHMTTEDFEKRAEIDYVIKKCDEILKDLKSQEICQKFSGDARLNTAREDLNHTPAMSDISYASTLNDISENLDSEPTSPNIFLESDDLENFYAKKDFNSSRSSSIGDVFEANNSQGLVKDSLLSDVYNANLSPDSVGGHSESRDILASDSSVNELIKKYMRNKDGGVKNTGKSNTSKPYSNSLIAQKSEELKSNLTPSKVESSEKTKPPLKIIPKRSIPVFKSPNTQSQKSTSIEHIERKGQGSGGQRSSAIAKMMDRKMQSKQGSQGSAKGQDKKENETTGYSIADILDRLECALAEKYLWAICKECVFTLIRESKDAEIAPTTTVIEESGHIVFRSTGMRDVHHQYIAPEIQLGGRPTEKCHIFSIAAMLWAAADHNLSTNQEPELSGFMQNLLVTMTQDDPASRPSLSELLQVCNDHDREESSSTTCQQLLKDVLKREAHSISQELKRQLTERARMSPFFDQLLDEIQNPPRKLRKTSKPKEQEIRKVFQENPELMQNLHRVTQTIHPSRNATSDSVFLPTHSPGLKLSGSPSRFRPIESPKSSGKSPFSPPNETQGKVLSSKDIHSSKLPSAFNSPATHFQPIVISDSSSSLQKQEPAIVTVPAKRPGTYTSDDTKKDKDKMVAKKLREMKKNLMKNSTMNNFANDIEKDIEEEEGLNPPSDPKINQISSDTTAIIKPKTSTIDTRISTKALQLTASKPRDEVTNHGVKNTHIKTIIQSKQQDSAVLKSAKQDTCTSSSSQAQQNPGQFISTEGQNLSGQDVPLGALGQSVTPNSQPLSLPLQLNQGMLTNGPIQVQLQADPKTGILQLIPINVANTQPYVQSAEPGVQEDPAKQPQDPSKQPQQPSKQPTGTSVENTSKIQSKSEVESQSRSRASESTSDRKRRTRSASRETKTNRESRTEKTDKKSSLRSRSVPRDKLNGANVGIIPVEIDIQSSPRKSAKSQASDPPSPDKPQPPPRHSRKSSSTSRSESRDRKSRRSEAEIEKTRTRKSSSESSPEKVKRTTSASKGEDLKSKTDKKKRTLSSSDLINISSELEETEKPHRNKHVVHSNSLDQSDKRRHNLNKNKIVQKEISQESKSSSDTQISPRGGPSPDSGVSGLNLVNNLPSSSSLSLVERLLNNQDTEHQMKLRKITQLIRAEFAYDGWLENGVEDLAMAELVSSLANLKWETFCNAISEKYCDFYWEEELLTNLYIAVNGSEPVKTKKVVLLESQTAKVLSVDIPDSGLVLNNNGTNSSPEADMLPDNSKYNPMESLVRKESTRSERERTLLAFRPIKSDDERVMRRSSPKTNTPVYRPKGQRRTRNYIDTSDSTDTESIEFKRKPRRRGTHHTASGLDRNKSSSMSSLLRDTNMTVPENSILRDTPSRMNSNSMHDILNDSDLFVPGNVITSPEVDLNMPAGGDLNTPGSGSIDLNTPGGNVHKIDPTTVTLPHPSHGLHKSTKYSSDTENDSFIRSKSIDSLNTAITPRVNIHTLVGESYRKTSTPDYQSSGGGRRKPPNVDSFKYDSESSFDNSFSGPPTRGRNSSLDGSIGPSISLKRESSMDSMSVRQIMCRPLSREESVLSGSSDQSGVKGATSSADSVFSANSDTTGQSSTLIEPTGIDDVKHRGSLIYYGMDEQKMDDDVKEFASNLENSTEANLVLKMAEIQQQIKVEYKMKKKTEKFFAKLSETGKAGKGADSKAMVSKVSKQIQEMNEKLKYLYAAKRHIQMLQAEHWGLELDLLYSLAKGASQKQPLNLASCADHELLQYQTVNRKQVLYAGKPTGLMAYLFGRNALAEGYIHQFFYCYRYFATPQQLFNFIRARIVASGCINANVIEEQNRQKILHRARDILQAWIEGYYNLDFRHNPDLVSQLSDLVNNKTQIGDGEHSKDLTSLLEYCKNGGHLTISAAETSGGENGETENFLEAEAPRKWETFKAALHLSTKPTKLSGNKDPKAKLGMVACLERKKKETGGDVYFPNVSRKTDAFTLGDFTPNTLAVQITLMEQELFQLSHPVHYLDSRAQGIGTINESLNKSAISHRASVAWDEARDDSLFIDGVKVDSVIQRLIEHSQNVTHWVAAEIVSCSSSKTQLAVLSKFIYAAKICYDIRNFGTTIAILDGLETCVVRQLPVWRNLPTKCVTLMEELTTTRVFLKSDSNCLMKSEDVYEVPTIPCALLFLLHVQQLEIGGFKLANGLCKWHKIRSIAKVINQIRIFKEHTYTFESDPDLQDSLRQRMREFREHDLQTLALQQETNYHKPSTGLLQGALRKVKGKFQKD
ncbi:unnamed protein product [Owenia fusiformis]|uniref:Uncharacterized protein n=1 Tax=Owenia fusiformis TaxID=6347 RepID=A0A8J1XGV8_OWEFU|nr:unnamed protein product [Owenia fusiformis]